MSDITIRAGVDTAPLSAGLRSAQQQVQQFSRKFNNELGFEGERKVQSNLAGLIGDLSKARSMTDLVAISADRLENVFRSIASIGVAVTIGVALKSALEGAAKEATSIFDTFQKLGSFSPVGKTVADLERQKELVTESAKKIEEAGFLTKLLYGDGLKAAQKMVETEQQLLDIAIAKTREAANKKAIDDQDAALEKRHMDKGFEKAVKDTAARGESDILQQAITQEQTALAALNIEKQKTADAEKRKKIIDEIIDRENKIATLQSALAQSDSQNLAAKQKAADEEVKKQKEILDAAKEKSRLEMEQIAARYTQVDPFGDIPGSGNRQQFQLDSVAQLGGALKGVNYDALMPKEDQTVQIQKEIAEATKKTSQTLIELVDMSRDTA